MHMIMWVMSDRAIPRSFRMMEGFGVHTFRMINAEGKSTFVKFHWKPKLGMQSVVWNEALKINGADPDFHRRDLWDAIGKGDFPEWELGLQIFDEKFAEQFAFDVLDATKIIPEEEIPVRRVGRLVLDRRVENFFAETEQVAFCTQNIVPGIDFTEDPLLQGRNFSYLDTQLKRLGSPNFTQIPINAPKTRWCSSCRSVSSRDPRADGGPSAQHRRRAGRGCRRGSGPDRYAGARTPAAQPTRMDLDPSPALSIQSNPPESFKGRIMGVLLSDGFDGALLATLETGRARMRAGCCGSLPPGSAASRAARATCTPSPTGSAGRRRSCSMPSRSFRAPTVWPTWPRQRSISCPGCVRALQVHRLDRGGIRSDRSLWFARA
jgi:hypothetical protein